MSAIIPIPREAIEVRVATATDIPFIDSLQKMHSHMVGWMPTKQLEGKIGAGHVLIAEEEIEPRSHGDTEARSNCDSPSLPPRLCGESASAVGYVISQDQYMKRDDVGIVYQLNVLPMKQRNLIGAMLIKSVFERAAYGCRLFCCWCAQDIRANFFWESIGFIPLAFRTGSRDKQRTHIFWQRRIREGDTSTPYWFPAQTGSGSIREDRLVLPIPPGTHWRDVMPVLLPTAGVLPGVTAESARDEVKMLPGGEPVRPRPEQPKFSAAQKAAIQRSQSKHLRGVPLGKKAVITASGIKYVERTDYVAETDAPEELAAVIKPKRAVKPRVKHDPEQIAAARELRDRYLEQFNRGLVLPGGAAGKYEVARMLESAEATGVEAKRLPEAA
jgi:hypothetical protein